MRLVYSGVSQPHPPIKVVLSTKKAKSKTKNLVKNPGSLISQ